MKTNEGFTMSYGYQPSPPKAEKGKEKPKRDFNLKLLKEFFVVFGQLLFLTFLWNGWVFISLIFCTFSYSAINSIPKEQLENLFYSFYYYLSVYPSILIWGLAIGCIPFEILHIHKEKKKHQKFLYDQGIRSYIEDCRKMLAGQVYPKDKSFKETEKS